MPDATLASDPRTAGAFAEWERNIGRPTSTDLKTSIGFLGLLYPSETVLWIGRGVALSPHQNLIIGFTEKRMIVAGKKWTSRYSFKPRNVEENRVDGSLTTLTVSALGVSPMSMRIERLPSPVLKSFLAKQNTSFTVDVLLPRIATFMREGNARSSSSTGQFPESTKAQPAAVGSWKEAEEFAAWHMRSLGFHDARVTNAGSDGGIDAIATGAVAQVKHYETTIIGRPVVQQLRGAAHGVPWAVFYARSGYTKAAIEYADQAQVALFKYIDSGTVSAQSHGAHHLLQQRSPGTSPGIEGFTQSMEAQSKGQQEIDKAVTDFANQSRTIMKKLQNSRGRQRQVAIAQVEKETDAVSRIITAVSSQHRSLKEVLNHTKQIRAATSRIKRIRA